jgi:hypothetical protein
MKALKPIIPGVTSSLLLAAILGFSSSCATEKSPAELKSKAKITQDQAQQIALAKAPGGTLKSGELEEEKGKLIWSFDIAVPNSKDTTEVAVDAITGDVVSVQKETPAQEAKEKKEK